MYTIQNLQNMSPAEVQAAQTAIEKQVMKRIASFLLLKIAIYVGIYYAAKKFWGPSKH